MSKSKLPLSDAEAMASAFVSLVAPACTRTLIAGSVRRRKAEIGDIEIVAVPRTEAELDMFGFPTGAQVSALDALLDDLALPRTKNGPKYKQLTYAGTQIDLFLATPETWGCVATIRTGSADFSRWLVTELKYGGAKPHHLTFEDGRLLANGQALATPEERDVFAALDLPWVAVEDRTEDRTEGRWRGRGRPQ